MYVFEQLCTKVYSEMQHAEGLISTPRYKISGESKIIAKDVILMPEPGPISKMDSGFQANINSFSQLKASTIRNESSPG